MQFTAVPETAKVIKFHAAAAAPAYTAELAPRLPMRSSGGDRSELMAGLRGGGSGQMDCAMQDLKAFERRLTEVIGCAKPAAMRWRIILGIVTICTAVGAWQWINDPAISKVSFLDSLWLHPFFLISSLVLLCLFLPLGVHSRVVAHNIIASRTRSVLEDFNMSCDDNGKLILRPTAVAT